MTTLTSGSLREHDDRVGRLVLQIRGVRHAIVLTEGPTDVFVLEKTVSREQLFEVNGRNNVLQLADRILAAGESRFVAVFDRDFDEVAYDEDAPHFPYEGNDLESCLVELGLLADLLRIRGSQQKLESRGGVVEIVEKLKLVVAPVSRLRCENAALGWGLNFDACELSKFISQKNLELDVTRYCASLHNARKRSGLDGPDLAELISAASNPNEQTLYRGKDLVAVASVALREYAGGLSKSQADPDSLAEALHLAARHAIPSSVWGRRLRQRMVDRAAT